MARSTICTSGVEVVWGIGTVRWERDGRRIERPLIECGVEIELAADGRLTVRPTGAEPRVDLTPYESMGCSNLASLEELARREILRTEAEDGISPFRPESFEPLLAAAATRLAAEGVYRRDEDPAADASGPVITGDWVFFARPRSQHVVLDDIARFRGAARGGVAIAGLAERLVTPPAEAVSTAWEPLADRLGEIGEREVVPEGAGTARHGQDPHDREPHLPRLGARAARAGRLARRSGPERAPRSAPRESEAPHDRDPVERARRHAADRDGDPRDPVGGRGESSRDPAFRGPSLRGGDPEDPPEADGDRSRDRCDRSAASHAARAGRRMAGRPRPTRG